MLDLSIIETLDGGDSQLVGKDLALYFGIENMPYLAMFGGNPGYSTGVRKPKEEAFDYWANTLLMAETPSQQFNSLTEYTLQTVALNSAGRITIQRAIEADLDFLKVYGKVSIEVSIISDDRIFVYIKIERTDEDNIVWIVTFEKQPAGDWYFADFDKNDFYI